MSRNGFATESFILSIEELELRGPPSQSESSNRFSI